VYQHLRKDQPFLRQVARLGCDVVLLTVDKLKDGDWPRESLNKLITMPEDMTPGQVLDTVSHMARGIRFDRVVALDEFDLEVAALVREHMRLPGMGESATRFFRDKLAMRVRGQQHGMPVPEFTSVFYYDDLRGFMNYVPGPWLLKPRTNAFGDRDPQGQDAGPAVADPRRVGRSAVALCVGAFRAG
jgi:hypothetical protein